MFDWLFEGRPSVYSVLAALAVFLLLTWWQTRKRWLLAGVAVAAGLIGLYALLDKWVETDREQIVRKIKEIADDLKPRSRLDAAFAHFSDQFRSPAGKNKHELRLTAREYLGREVDHVQVWDIQIEGRPSREQGEVHVFFSAKAHNSRDFLTDVDAVFEFHPEHGWQLKSFRLLKPQTNEEWGWPI